MCYKTSTEILESHLGGPLIFEKYVWTMENYDENDIEKTSKMIAKASEGLYAFLYLENLDQDKYGSIISNLNSQKSLGNDQYPRTIVETNNVLSNHKFDISKGKKPQIKNTITRANRRRIKTKQKSLHCRLHKWKASATVVENRDTSLPNAEAKRKFRER
jgi:hypothetical protein